MSFNKLSYDTCTYKASLANNVSILDYVLYPGRYYHTQQCRPEIGIVGGNNVSQVRNPNLVDLESDLFGIDREASKCPSLKYVPKNDNYVQGKNYIKPEYPKVDTTLNHLRSCQFHKTLDVPYTPTSKLSQCYN